MTTLTEKPFVTKALYWVLAIALVTRLFAAFYLGNTVSGLSGAHDEISYSMLGQRFAEGHGMTFPSGWYPWIKPDTPQSYYSYTISLYLGIIYQLFGYEPIVARIITGALSTLIVLLIYVLARRFFNERIALITGAVAAVYGYLIFYGVTLVTETPFTVALLLSIYLCLILKEREQVSLWHWVLLGVSLAITVLLRMAVVFFVPILLGWLALEMRDARYRARLAIPIIVILLAVAPFTMRNYLLWGQFSLLETQFGHVFWNGNHPGHNGDFHPFKVFDIPADVLALNNDVAITNTLLRMGIQNVLQDPWHFVLLTITRLREFFTFWPTADSGKMPNLMRVLSFGLIVPFAVFGLIANLSRFRALAPVYLFMLMHTGIYAATWTMIRYRIPLDPFFIMFAAYTFELLYNWLRKPAPLYQPKRLAES